MAEIVIDVFEIVNIQKKCRQQLIFGMCPDDCLFQILIIKPSVWKTGQSIVIGLMVQLRFVFQPLRQISGYRTIPFYG